MAQAKNTKDFPKHIKGISDMFTKFSFLVAEQLYIWSCLSVCPSVCLSVHLFVDGFCPKFLRNSCSVRACLIIFKPSDEASLHIKYLEVNLQYVCMSAFKIHLKVQNFKSNYRPTRKMLSSDWLTGGCCSPHK